MNNQTPTEVKTAQAANEAELTAAMIKQLTFKPGISRDVSVQIVVQMYKDRIKWSDEIDFAFVQPPDRNAIGMSWKRLIECGIVQRMNQTRRSKREGTRGRTIWKYRLASAKLAEAFMRANGTTIPERGQMVMFTMNEDKPTITNEAGNCNQAPVDNPGETQ